MRQTLYRRFFLVFVFAVSMFVAAARAQSPEPQRPLLRPDLKAAAEHLTQHLHPYAMTEEVARVRLEKLGFEKVQSIRPVADNVFHAEVLKNGQLQKVEIERITGQIKQVQ